MNIGANYDFCLNEKGQYDQTLIRSVHCVAAEAVSICPLETKQVSLQRKELIGYVQADVNTMFYFERKTTEKKFDMATGIVDSDRITVFVTKTM